MGRRNTIILIFLFLAGCMPTKKGEYELIGNREALMQGRMVWMTNKENRQIYIDAAHGTVWTFGLGLGFFAEEAANKDEVDKVVVIEISPEVVELIKPRLGNKKIEIIQADAWEWVKTAEGPVDFIYADIWTGDEPDFQEQRKRTKQLCKRFGCEVMCWEP